MRNWFIRFRDTWWYACSFIGFVWGLFIGGVYLGFYLIYLGAK